SSDLSPTQFAPPAAQPAAKVQSTKIVGNKLLIETSSCAIGTEILAKG
ncbi:hypothetical protein CEXT_711281, partial [Caerostris extrusa]